MKMKTVRKKWLHDRRNVFVIVDKVTVLTTPTAKTRKMTNGTREMVDVRRVSHRRLILYEVVDRVEVKAMQMTKTRSMTNGARKMSNARIQSTMRLILVEFARRLSLLYHSACTMITRSTIQVHTSRAIRVAATDHKGSNGRR